MAIAVDASTPAVATSTSTTVATLASASFTPPAGSVIFVLWAGNSGPSENVTTAPTITDNRGAPLTYTLINHRNRGDTSPSGSSGQAAMWRAVVPTSSAMTITTTTAAASGNRQQAFLALVLTGVDTTTPVGTVGESSTNTGSLSQAVVGTTAGSLALAAWSDWQTSGSTFTAGTGCTVAGSSTMGGNCNFAAVRRTTADGTNGGSTTVALSAPTSNAQNWVYAEVLPSAGGSSSVSAGNAAGTGAAQAPTPRVAPTLAAGTATGAAPAPAPAAAVNAGVSAATAAANGAQPGKLADAGQAAATGTASSPAAATSVTAGLATAAGAVPAVGPVVSPATGHASATGAALDATATASPLLATGTATGTGAALTGAASVAANAGTAAGTGAAGDAAAGNAIANVSAAHASASGIALNTAIGQDSTVNLFGATSGPGAQEVDGGNYTLAVEFYVTTDTPITAVRFWAAATVTGSDHACRVYDVLTQTLVIGTTAAFPSPLQAGWNVATLAAPVTLTANTRYRAAVWFTTDNGYTATANYWSAGAGAAGITNGVLVAPNAAAATDAEQGTFRGGSDGFPDGSFNSANYWVDPVVGSNVAILTAPPTTATATGAAGGMGTHVTFTAGHAAGDGTAFTTAAATTNAAASPATATGAAHGLTTATSVTAGTATGTGAASGVTAGAAVNAAAAHARGVAMERRASVGQGFEALVGDNPAAPAATETAGPVTVGVAFSALGPVAVVGARYITTVEETGTVTAVLYDNAGTQLASKAGLTDPLPGTYDIYFDTPVQLNTSTIYVIALHHPSGTISYTPNFWSGDFTSPGGHLFTSSGGSYGGGRFAYGASPTFPNGSSSAWYAVDPLTLPTGATVAAGPALGTGAAGDATNSFSQLAPAGLASGTGAVLFDPTGNTISLELTAAAPITGSGSAFDATVPPTGVAPATGAANTPTVQVSIPAGAATGAGAGLGPSPQVAKPVSAVVGSGAALAATVSASSPSTAAAGRGDGNGAALTASVSASPNAFAGPAAATGAAGNATGLPAPIMAAATGTGSANTASEVRVTPAVQSLIGATGTAHQPTAVPGEQVATGHAAGSGAGLAADGRPAVNAGSAAATGAAHTVAVNAAGVTSVPIATIATTGTAGAPSVRVDAASGTGAGTAAASGATTSVTVNADIATASGAAPAAFAAGADSFAAQAGTAEATGSATALLSDVTFGADVAGGDGAALLPTGAALPTLQPYLGAGVGNALRPRVVSHSTASPAASGGAWGALLALVREARNPAPDPREAASCPNDGFTLLADPHGGVRCPFDGYRR